MRIETKSEAGSLVLLLRDDHLGADVAAEFKRQVMGQLLAGVRVVLMDISQVTFIDSTGLGALVAIRKRLGDGGVLAICGAQPLMLELFQLTRLDKIFQFFPDIEIARQHLLAEPVSR
jgi:anti-sigma B factor antagonist